MTEYTITTDPDISDRWAQLNADQKAHNLIANRATDETIAERARDNADRLTVELADLEADVAAAARIITVERVSPKVWGRIVAENRPRPDDPYDARMGFNSDTFDTAVMPHAIVSVTDGNLEPVEWDWDGLVATMSPGTYEQIIGDVLRANMNREAVPFSLADYQSRRSSEQN